MRRLNGRDGLRGGGFAGAGAAVRRWAKAAARVSPGGCYPTRYYVAVEQLIKVGQPSRD